MWYIGAWGERIVAFNKMALENQAETATLLLQLDFEKDSVLL